LIGGGNTLARLEDITVGAIVTGLAGNATVSVVAVRWHGNNAITVTFKNSAGNVAEQILYREDAVEILMFTERLMGRRQHL